MGITFETIRSWNRPIASTLKEWEAACGDNDATLDMNDLLPAAKVLTGEARVRLISQLWAQLPNHPKPSESDSPESFSEEIAAVLSCASGQTEEEIEEELKIRPQGSASSGDSADIGVINDFQPAAKDIRESAFQWQLALLGVPREEMGWTGWRKARMSDTSAYVEGKMGLGKLLASALFNSPDHVNPEANHQIFATPGMTSWDANHTQAQMRKNGSSASRFFSKPLGDSTQFRLCYDALKRDNERGLTDLVYFDHTGDNDTTTFGSLLISPTVTPEEFSASLEERFQILRGQKAVAPGEAPHAIEGLSLIRIGLLSLAPILVPVTEGRMIASHKPYREEVIPPGSHALGTTAALAAAGDLVDGCDVLTPEEYEQFIANQDRLRAEEKRVCEQYGILLMDSAKYLEAMSQHFSLDELISLDGLHPTAFATAFIGLARALEMRKIISMDPSPEVLSELAARLNVSPEMIQSAMRMSDPLQAFCFVADAAEPPQNPYTAEQRLRAARFFSQWFYPTLRGENPVRLR